MRKQQDRVYQNATIIDGLHISSSKAQYAKNDIIEWVTELDLLKIGKGRIIKSMKKLTAVLLIIFIVISLSACSGNNSAVSTDNSFVKSTENESGTGFSKTESDSKTEHNGLDTETFHESESKETGETDKANETTDKEESEEESIIKDESRILVAYFSCTNTTRPLAEYIADSLNADQYEIVPKQPYTDADLNYHDDNSRSTIEMNDKSARPAISGAVENIGQYDIIFIGYPIWWGEAPRIMSTFMESYDFSGKTIVPFCTSGGSGIGSSATNLETLTNGATWLSGSRLNGSSSRETIVEWINSLELDVTAQ